MPEDTTRQFFDRVGEKYEEGFAHDEGLVDFLQRALTFFQPGPSVSVLDVGQGTGKPVSSVLSASGCQVHGIDLSPVMVRLAQTQVPHGTFEAINMLEFSPVKPFDVAFAMFSHFQFTSSEMMRLASKWREWVKPGGLLFVGTMLADDFPDGSFAPDSLDGQMGRVVRKFMGDDASLLVLTRAGWQRLLQQHGLTILHTEMTLFEAPASAECDVEPHSYFVCQMAQ